MRRRWFQPWRFARRLTAGAFLALLILGSHSWFPWVRGSTSSAEWFSWLRLTDPLAALEYTLATREIHPPLWLGAGLLLAFGALFGPVFCSWVCPLGLLLEINQTIRRWVAQVVFGRRPTAPAQPLRHESRYLLLAAALCFSVVAGWPLFQLISPIHAVAWALTFSLHTGWLLVGIVVAAEWIVPRLWCRSICPLGAVYSLVGGRAPFRVVIDPDRAGRTPCQLCTLGCPMGVRVMEDYSIPGAPSVADPACTRCGACVDQCPSTVLRLGWQSGWKRGATRDFATLTIEPNNLESCPKDETMTRG